MVGIVTPGVGRWLYQAIASAISAAWAATIAVAEVPQRKTPVVSDVSWKAFMAISFGRRGRPVRS